jgi:anti-sigma factor RsiW
LNHLSDEQIQDFLDGNLPDREEEIRAHLDSCTRCREEADRYLVLYMELTKAPENALMPGFADRVVADLQPETGNGKFAVDRLVLATAALGCLITTLILFGWGPIAALGTSLLRGAMRLWFDTAGSAWLDAHLETPLLLAAGAVLCLVAAADRLVLKPMRETTVQR